jgi:acyl-CoA synthetase (AMP-forming)/AMP-acid ligase II
MQTRSPGDMPSVPNLPDDVPKVAEMLVRRAANPCLSEFIAEQVARHPGRIALKEGKEGKRAFTYAELDERTNRLVNALTGLGVRQGDRIAVLAENRLEYIELEIAAAKMGAILACQNWRQANDELEHCLRLVSPRLIIASARHAPALERIAHGVETVIRIEDAYEQMLAQASPACYVPDRPLDPEDGMIILYTSGTTGLPKGALISQRAMIARMTVARLDGLLQPADTFIAWAPMFHMVSTDQALATLMTGGTVIVMDGLDVPALVGCLAQEKIGHLTLIPGMIDLVIDELQRSGIQAKGVRTLGCMADLVPREQIARITTLLQAPFLNSFGATETGAPPASRGLIPIGDKPAKLPKEQSSNCIVRLVDTDGNEVPDGMPGEMAVRGPTLFSGYWGAASETEKDFRNGWFHMGDVFVRNSDGSLDYVDRRKYLIKSGGENIYPAEIERVLLSQPGIADAVVVRRPDPRWGEVPVAFVVRSDPGLQAAQVIEACRGRIAGYKLPKDVVFVRDDELPRSTTGKIKRHELEHTLASLGSQSAAPVPSI